MLEEEIRKTCNKVNLCYISGVLFTKYNDVNPIFPKRMLLALWDWSYCDLSKSCMKKIDTTQSHKRKTFICIIIPNW